jgi:hypothetical protein
VDARYALPALALGLTLTIASCGSLVTPCDGASTASCGGPAGGGGSSSHSVGTGSGGTGAATSSSGAGGAGGANDWTPQALPGLLLWLSADAGIVFDPAHPGIIKTWTDQSGNGNDAFVSNTVFTVDPSALGGHAAVRCGFGVFYLKDWDLGSSDYAIAVVARGDAKHARILGGIVNQYLLAIELDPGPGAMFTHGPTTLLTVPVADVSAFHVLLARGKQLSFTVDGKTVAGPDGGAPNTLQGIALCDVVAATKTEIAEVIAVKGSTSQADVDHLQAYFKAKFGL